MQRAMPGAGGHRLFLIDRKASGMCLYGPGRTGLGLSGHGCMLYAVWKGCKGCRCPLPAASLCYRLAGMGSCA